MEIVEVVIRLPKDKYDRLDYVDSLTVKEFIKNGTVLPKGHGRLKDIDQIINDGISKGFCDWYDEMEMADTIVKEDKEVENNGV